MKENKLTIFINKPVKEVFEYSLAVSYTHLEVYKRQIFDKGFTGTNGRNQKKSTGIGLYLCKRLCEEIGMNLKAESIENEYTEMIITIPRLSLIHI